MRPEVVMKHWFGAPKNHLFFALIALMSLSLHAAQPLKKAGDHKRSPAQAMAKSKVHKAINVQAQGRAFANAKVQKGKQGSAKSPTWVKPAAIGMAAPLALSAMQRMESHLSDEALAIAERVHKGHLPCELGASVRVEPNAHQPGYFDVRGNGFHYRMHPVTTSTGAIRLEDKQAGAVWLQLANKSMLMDQKRGRRIADECAHPEQMAFAQNMKHNPPPKLFDTTGMGR
jgi:hypothetical protein